ELQAGHAGRQFRAQISEADVSGVRPRSPTTNKLEMGGMVMARPHQPGESDFRSILPEDIDWKPFPAFPAFGPAGRAGRRSHATGTLCHTSKGAVRGEADAAQAPRRPAFTR